MLNVTVEGDIGERGLALLCDKFSRVEDPLLPSMTKDELPALVRRWIYNDELGAEQIGAAGSVLVRLEGGPRTLKLTQW